MIFRRRKEARKITRKDSLTAKPLRNINVKVVYDEVADTTTLEFPVQHPRAIRAFVKVLGLLARTRTPPTRKIELDEIGSLVWSFCDGKSTVKDIARKVAQKHNLPMREAEYSTGLFVKSLVERKLLALDLSDLEPPGEK